jgi:DMSO/TMAO reductase YedYZ molybdopterin-dependent catalytic subunit
MSFRTLTLRAAGAGLACVSAFALGLCGLSPAQAGCELVKATASESSPAEAARTSQALVLQGANDLKRARRWAYLTLYAHKVKGDPFWKAVRPNGVPDYAQIKPDIVTPRFYTTCFTGVVVPYVCTTGSAACGQ